ncbi:MAG: DUF1592 domain-containing protein [Sandaracinaceae bacterium]
MASHLRWSVPLARFSPDGRPALGRLALGCLALGGLALGCTDSVAPYRPGDPNPPLTCTDEIRAERAPLLRLTSDQYDNVVSDLLGIDTHPSERIEADERNGTFASNSSSPVSRVVVEQYQTVAEDLARQAVRDVDALLDCDRLALGDAECVRRFIARTGRLAYRRTLTSDELATYEALYATWDAEGGVSDGLRVVIGAMLQSPHFLYRPELLPDAGNEGDVVRVRGTEIATRLAFFFWASAPDEALLDAAEAGELDTDEGVRAEAERLLGDVRAARTISSFHLQWLGLDQIEHLDKDPGEFPEFDGAMRFAMRQETATFADDVIRYGDGRLRTLLTAPYSFLSGPLFDVYGVSEPSGHALYDPVELDPTQRAGLLTQAGVIASAAHSRVTSPTRMGRLVRERFFCQPLEDPPPGVDTTLPEVGEDASTRERLSVHMQSDACSGCHRLTDPIGFGFEHYDPIGRWRDTDGAHAIDARIELERTDIDGTYDGAVELAQAMAESPEVSACVARTWFAYATTRSGAGEDACAVQALEQRLRETDDLFGLLIELAVSDGFVYRQL